MTVTGPDDRAEGTPSEKAGASPAAYDFFVDDFDAPELDVRRWLPHYLPAWSSRRDTAATWHISDSCVSLEIPAGHPIWCPDDHEPPLRVSGIQSGNQSGPLGSTTGQQPFRVGQTVREEQPRFEGLLMAGGRFEIRCAMRISPRSMAAAWLVGFEDEPERCGELCVVEVFGRSVRTGAGAATAEVGLGVHAFRDPALVEDFVAPRLNLDPAEMHTYAVEWDAQTAIHLVDDVEVRRTPRPPAYPLQAMIAVFDFPDGPDSPAGSDGSSRSDGSSGSDGTEDSPVPALVIDRVAWRPSI